MDLRFQQISKRQNVEEGWWLAEHDEEKLTQEYTGGVLMEEDAQRGLQPWIEQVWKVRTRKGLKTGRGVYLQKNYINPSLSY